MSGEAVGGVAVTGAGGYLGKLVVARLARERDWDGRLIALDVREVPVDERIDGVTYLIADIREPELAAHLRAHPVDTVVHLAAVVSPGRKSDRAFEYSVDVEGTRNVLHACLDNGVGAVVVSSSGAAYGYHADNPAWLCEDDALRGNVEFAYSDHKRQVEEMLARWRVRHPELRQLIFRPGTILGATTRNQITDLFDGRLVLALRGAESPFVLIWDEDVAECFARGVMERRTGIYNLAGDGAVPLRELAGMLGTPCANLPVGAVREALRLMRMVGVTQYGPEQVDFLRYRPVLSNRRLKEEFGFTPRKTSRQVFEFFLAERRADDGG